MRKLDAPTATSIWPRPTPVDDPMSVPGRCAVSPAELQQSFFGKMHVVEFNRLIIDTG